MQAAQDYTALKAQLEERVANLKRDRDAAQREVESLNIRVAIKELERQAKALEGELDGLKGKRSLLEQKLASLDAPMAQTLPPQQRPPIRPAGL
jgi:chromosome segregation ATPase